MCSRHAEQGAGHPDNYHAFMVELREAEGPSFYVPIPNALGPHDARNQAREKARDQGLDEVGVIRVVPVP